jgi:hypothetical protein
VQVRDGDTGSKNCVIGVLRSQVGGSLGGQVLDLAPSNEEYSRLARQW